MATRGLFLLAAASVAACKWSFDPFGRMGGNPAVIAGVVVSPSVWAAIVGDTVRFDADAYGQSCDFDFCHSVSVSATFTWRSSDTTVATVAGGLVHAVGRGTAAVIATAAGVSDSASIRVGSAYIPLATVGAGGRCALTNDGVGYCWALNLPPYPLAIPDLRFSAIAAEFGLACGIAADTHGLCWSGLGVPSLVAADLQFQSLSPGRRNAANPDGEHTCGILLDSTAWCWGADDAGQLGTAAALSTCFTAEIGHNYPCSATPVPVTGLSGLIAITAGGAHTCALAADGTAYCWGDNTWGQLGDSSTVSRGTPAPVRAIPPLASISAGTDHTCGVTRSGGGAVYCWGHNQAGQLAIGSQDSLPHLLPLPIVGNLSVASLDGGLNTCALTPGGSVYCWGSVSAPPCPSPGTLCSGRSV